MDLKKEIKLSDLVRAAEEEDAGRAPPSRRAKRKRRGEAGVRRAQDRRLPARRLASRQQRRSAEARQLARVPLEPGVVVAGEVRDVAGARRGARRASSATTSCRGTACGSGSPRTGSACARSRWTGSRTSASSRNAIRFRAHEAVSIPIDQAVLDYHVVGEAVDEAGSVSRRIVLAAAYRESIDRYVEACRDADIELVGIDLEAFALLRAVAPPTRRATSRSPSSPSRSATTARRWRSPTASSATSRASSSGAARTSRPRSPASSASRATRPGS